jgi:hypothetical protein
MSTIIFCKASVKGHALKFTYHVSRRCEPRAVIDGEMELYVAQDVFLTSVDPQRGDNAGKDLSHFHPGQPYLAIEMTSDQCMR